MMNVTKAAACLVNVIFLASCGGMFEPVPVKTDLGYATIVSATPSLNHLILEQSADGRVFSCAHTGASAIFSQQEAADFSFTLVNFGDTDEASETEGSAEIEMAGRTPALLITQELFFRLCEFARNHRLSRTEAIELFETTLKTVSEGWTSEANNTTISIADDLRTSVTESGNISLPSLPRHQTTSVVGASTEPTPSTGNGGETQNGGDTEAAGAGNGGFDDSGAEAGDFDDMSDH